MNPVWIELHDVCVVWMSAVIWMIQLLVYPHFRSVPDTEFSEFHARHCYRISYLVWPMFIEALLCGMILFHTGLRPDWVLQFSGISVILMATAFLSIPDHNRLGMGKDPLAIERLIRTNWLRTAAWTLLTVAVIVRRART
jgi:hypothetical protein